MKVKIARSAGFCMGVRRAMEIVLAEVHKDNTKGLYTLGPLIHNSQVLELLESKGVKVLNDLKEAAASKVVIRAHGIPPGLRAELRKIQARIVDATCPKVARVQAIIRYYTRKGYTGIIVGDADHPEVVALKGYGDDKVWVISDESQVSRLPIDHQNVFVVAQTTQNAKSYEQIVKKIKERSPRALVFDTICEATHLRQEEVRALARQVDAIVVVGGYHSGNTRRLVEIARSTGKPAFHVETPGDLDAKALEKMDVVGVTAGASTPNWLIKDVVAELEKIKGKKETHLGRIINKIVKSLVLSNVAAASAAASMSYSVGHFLHKPSSIYPLITFLYIYAMHVLNRFLDRTASAYNEPERASFLMRHGRALAFMGALSILGAIGLSLKLGLRTFIALLVLSLLGLIYSVPLIPKGLRLGTRYRKIKDVPGSKTLSEALAWTALIIAIPLLNGRLQGATDLIVIGSCVLVLAFVRAAIFDIFQLQGDLIAGSETLPILLGEKRTLFLLKALLFVVGAGSLLAPAIGITTPMFCLAAVPAATTATCVLVYERAWAMPGISFEALVETNFILLGALVAIWVHL
ncbi:MAG TPA: 4-hydroxy-3-methylbut-2-enyl diphosphate reductase [Desulfobacteraceae bacterium]|nr:4-hydroxy-3-methylbut-2-enyl diphosphate reductase [Desulfobacteraceae bacterium]